MPSNLLIFPLLAGYCFLHLLAFTKYRAQRLDGHRLVLESALVAILLTGAARLAAMALAQSAWVTGIWAAIAPPFDFFGTALLSIIIGVVSPVLLNALGEAMDKHDRVRALLAKVWVFSNRRALSTAMRRHGSELHRILYTALDEERQVSITMDSKKVYIGYVYGAPKLEPHDSFVAILPLLSGYRSPETMDLKLTQNYLAVYAKDPTLRKADFVVVLPLAQIRSASFFEQSAYTRFEIEKSPPAIQSSTSPAVQ